MMLVANLYCVRVCVLYSVFLGICREVVRHDVPCDLAGQLPHSLTLSRDTPMFSLLAR